MAGTFVPTPGSYSNLSLLEQEQLEKADFYAGSKALTQGYAGTGGFSLNAEPYFTGPELFTQEVLPSTVSQTPGLYLNVGSSNFTTWMGPTILWGGTTGNADPVTPAWVDTDSGTDFTTYGIVAGDLVLIKDTTGGGGANANIVGVISSVIDAHNLGLSATTSALTADVIHYTYVIAHPAVNQLFAVPGSGPLGQEQTFLSVGTGSTIHNQVAPSLDLINASRVPYIIPPYMSGTTDRDRSDAVFASPAPFNSLEKLGYRLVLYPDNGAGAPDLAHPISALNPIIDAGTPADQQRMTIDYRAGVIRFSCPPTTGGDIKPSSGCVNPTTLRLNLYAVYWTYDTGNGPLGTAAGLYVPLSTSLDFHDPARVYYDNVTNHAWMVQGDARFQGTTELGTTNVSGVLTGNARIYNAIGGFATAPSIIGTSLAHYDIGVGGYFPWSPNTQAPYLVINVSNDGETPSLTLPAGTTVGQRITVRYTQSKTPLALKGRSGLTWKGSFIAQDQQVLTPAIGYGACTTWELIWDLGVWIPSTKSVTINPGGSNTYRGFSPPVDYLNPVRNLTQRFTSYQVAPATPPIGFPSGKLHYWYFGRVASGSDKLNIWLAAYADSGLPDTGGYLLYSQDDCRTWILPATDPGAAIQDVVCAYNEPSNLYWMCILQGSSAVYASSDVANWAATSGALTMTDPRAVAYLGVDGTLNQVFIVGGASATHPLERSANHGSTWDNTVLSDSSTVLGFAVNLHTGVAMAYTDTSTGVIYKTTNWGAAWTSIVGGGTFYEVISLAYLPGCGTWVMVSDNTGTYSVLTSVDDGVTWTVVLASSPQFTKIKAFGPSILVGIASDSTAAYLVSADCGATWMRMDGGGAWDVSRVTPAAATDLAAASVYGPFSELLITYRNATDWSTAVSQRVVESNEEYG